MCSNQSDTKLTNLLDELLDYTPRGNTATDEAIAMALDPNIYFPGGPGDRHGVTNVILLITDGEPYPVNRTPKALTLAREAEEKGIVLFVVGIASIDEEILKSLSSAPHVLNEDYFTPTDFNSLNQISESVAEQTCRRSHSASG